MGIAPTKSNLLRLRDDLVHGTEARDLLEQRREILLAELTRYLHRRREARRKIRTALEAAVGAMVRARMATGSLGLRRIMLAPKAPPALRIWEQGVMGAQVPVVELRLQEEGPRLPLMEGGGRLEQLDGKLGGLLDTIGPWLEAEGATWRLAAEVARTQRRVRALEKMVIPELEAAVGRIAEALDEAEREEYFRRRRLKAGRGRM